MSKKTGGWNGYDPCESGGGAGKKWGRFGSVEKFGKSFVDWHDVFFVFFCVPVVGKGIIKNGDGHYC